MPQNSWCYQGNFQIIVNMFFWKEKKHFFGYNACQRRKFGNRLGDTACILILNQQVPKKSLSICFVRGWLILSCSSTSNSSSSVYDLQRTHGRQAHGTHTKRSQTHARLHVHCTLTRTLRYACERRDKRRRERRERKERREKNEKSCAFGLTFITKEQHHHILIRYEKTLPPSPGEGKEDSRWNDGHRSGLEKGKGIATQKWPG